METFHLSTFNFQLIKVAIVDDHKMVADGFERIINESGVAGVIGKAYSLSGGMKLLAQSDADVLLLDVNLPDGNSIDFLPQIKTQHPHLKIVILTSHSELTVIKRALDGGVSGYIMKNAAAEEIIEGIETVLSGKRFFCKETTRLLQQNTSQTPLLSRREEELLRLIVAGKSNAEIADAMFLGYETVKSYRKRLMLKLDVNNTAELVRKAMEDGLG